MAGARRIKSEKLREPQYKEGYSRFLEGNRVEWDRDNNVKHMWDQVEQAMVESAREVCGSVKVGGKNPKSVWLNDEIKAVGWGKEATWKVLATSDEETKERCMEVYREEKRKVKRCIYQRKKESK